MTQLAALALWMRVQRAYQEMSLKREARPAIKHINVVCAEPMPGEGELLDEFVAALRPVVLGDVVRDVFEKMRLAGETGGLLRIEDDISEKLAEARKDWVEMRRRQAELKEEHAAALFEYKAESPQAALAFDVSDITDEEFWQEAEVRVVEALREYAARASNGRGLLRRLFADAAEQGFAFVDLCRKKFDVVLMNPPFGDASIPSKPYIDATYGDTKGDVYKAFVECFQDRLVPGGYLGIISSRTGFFLSQSADWRERVVLRLYRPLLLADFGMGVLDALVETAAYVLRSLTEKEDAALTLSLVPEVERVPKDKHDVFSTKKYADMRELKRHQANGELNRLHKFEFIESVEGSFPRWKLTRDAAAQRRSVSASAFPPLVCLRLLGEEDKESAIREVLANTDDTRRFVIAPEEFEQIPNSPFAYRTSYKIRHLYKTCVPLEQSPREARRGSWAGNDSRYLRLWFEVDPALVGRQKKWVSFAKGGDYSTYYYDFPLVVDWDDERKTFRDFYGRPGRETERPESLGYYFRPGATWPLRTARGLNVRALPAGFIFSNVSPTVFDESETSLWELLALMNSSPFKFLLDISQSAFAFQVGVLQRTPVPSLRNSDGMRLGDDAKTCVYLKQRLDTVNEISHVFQLPALMQAQGATLTERGAAWAQRVADANSQLSANQAEIDRIAFRLYGIDPEEVVGGQWSVVSEEKSESDTDDETDNEDEGEQPTTDHRPLTTDLLSYALGCAMGRWDIRYATGAQQFALLPDPFAPLPVCAPAALTGEDNLPLLTAPEAYPLEPDWDGILTDDEHHPDDIITRVRRVFDLIFGDSSEAREQEACQLLGVRSLRDYFRKTTLDGFWQHHIKRHSKSRRKAPIYWLLQSSKKNYALWLYYHRLTRDTLYKALINYVEPKLRLEENKLAEMKGWSVGGKDGSVSSPSTDHRPPTTKQLERRLDAQESFISELNDFRDKLKRAADLGLDFDLNDGVVLNIAPLWELVPWTEAKKYWTELTGGKHEWSSTGKQLRAKGMVRSS